MTNALNFKKRTPPTGHKYRSAKCGQHSGLPEAEEHREGDDRLHEDDQDVELHRPSHEITHWLQ